MLSSTRTHGRPPAQARAAGSLRNWTGRKGPGLGAVHLQNGEGGVHSLQEIARVLPGELVGSFASLIALPCRGASGLGELGRDPL